MQVEINWLAVVLATISSMVVGSIWYAPPVFGTMWMKMAGIDKKKAEANGFKPLVIAVVLSALTAYVLAHVTYLSNSFFGNSFFNDAVTTAFWMWLGFGAARLVVHEAFESRPLKLSVLNAAHELVTFLAMGVIIGWLKP